MCWIQLVYCLILLYNVSCVPLANKCAEVHNYMNDSVKPCTNFYEFACGKWAKIHPADADQHISTGVLELLDEAFKQKVAVFLQAEVNVNDTEVDTKIKDFYKSCMRFDSTTEVYKQKLKNLIEEFGEMPALRGVAWNESEFDWLESVAKITHKYGVDIMMSIQIDVDIKNTSINRVFITAPELMLDSKAMYVDAINEVYRENQKLRIKAKLKSLLQVNDNEAAQLANEILNFEISLANGMLDQNIGLTLDDTARLTTLAEMQKKYAPIIDIERFINISLDEHLDDEIYETYTGYLENLKEVLAITPKRVLANYIFYSLLDDNFLFDEDELENTREVYCMAKTTAYFAHKLDNMVYRSHKTQQIEHHIEDIWQLLKQTFRAQLEEANKYSWINVTTRQNAIKKLDAMRLEFSNYVNTNFTAEFADLLIDADDFIENIRNILKLRAKRAIERLHDPKITWDDYEMLSYTPVNLINENLIKIPVSMLQAYYLWHEQCPTALKFGSLGLILAHELMHGFDDDGRKYNELGNRLNWWDEVSRQSFEQRTECFMQQYSKYSYGNRFLRTNKMQAENIADNGGLRLAYAAYLKWYADAKAASEDFLLDTLPLMDYTNRQLFFIGFAQTWCNDYYSTMRAYRIDADEHVPEMYRVIGSLSNFPEFAKEFQCESGSPMNPMQKCEIY